MLHLIRLEFRKVHFRKYIMLFMVAIFSSMFFTLAAVSDSGMGGHSFDYAFRGVEMAFAFIFIILFSVMNSSLILSEYNNKTILLMFTYPIDKKKLILAKLSIVTCFIAAAVLTGYLICGAFIVFLDRRYDMLAGDFTMEILESWAWSALSTMIVFCCSGILTFAAGMLKKSVNATIVSSMVLIFLRQVAITADGSGEDNIFLVAGVFAAALAAVWYSITYKLSP